MIRRELSGFLREAVVVWVQLTVTVAAMSALYVVARLAESPDWLATWVPVSAGAASILIPFRYFRQPQQAVERFRRGMAWLLAASVVSVIVLGGTGQLGRPNAQPPAETRPLPSVTDTPAGTKLFFEPTSTAAARPNQTSAPLAKPTNTSTPKRVVRLASLPYKDQIIVTELYAKALEARAYRVDRHFSLGSRETVEPALESGQIDVYSDYLASIYAFVTKASSKVTDSTEGQRLLQFRLSERKLVVLEAAPAVVNDAFVVTKAWSSGMVCQHSDNWLLCRM